MTEEKKLESHMHEVARHQKRVEEFLEKWEVLRPKVADGLVDLHETREDVSSLKESSSAERLATERIADALETNFGTLLDKATGKNSVPMLAHLLVVAVICLIWFLREVRDSNRDVHVGGSSGVSITSPAGGN